MRRRVRMCWLGVLLWFPAIAGAQAVTVPGDFPNIQSAIAAVVAGSLPDGTVIQIQPGTYNEALLINDTPRSLTLRGLGGPSGTVVSAAGKGQSALRIIRARGVIDIEGLTFRDGTGVVGTGGGFTFEDSSPQVFNVVVEANSGVDSGGGVLSQSHARFVNSIIRSNSAARFAGGIAITTGSRPTFTNCQILNNVSGTGGPGLGSIGSGGGVHTNDASPIFRGSVIAGNQAKFGGGGIIHIGVFGSSNGPAILVLEDTEVSNNTASRFSSADNPSEGGGVHIEDNAVGYLVRARILSNTSNTSGGLSAYRARYELRGSIVEANHAQDPQLVGGFGGGIGISSNNVSMPLQQASSLVMVDSVVRGNDARAGGGIFATGDQACGSPTPNCNDATATRAIVQLTSSLVDGNAAGTSAGGIRADRVDLTITDSHIIRNAVTAAGGQSYGGGLLMGLRSDASITGSTIAGNSAVDFGGGLFLDQSSTIAMTQSQVYRNTAASGGGFYVGSAGTASGTIQDSTIADNSTYQIHEQACGALTKAILTYNNNVITPRSGFSDLYFSTCGGATTSISTFNGFSRTSGNRSDVPSFRTFLATPDVSGTYLSWIVSRATSVNISGSAFAGDVGSTPAAPPASGIYTLTNTGGPGGSSSVPVVAPLAWGISTDAPVAGDFDGDGRNDFAIYRGATGQWFVATTSAGPLQATWGSPASGDVPAAADYNGDGRTDIAVYRTATGEWFIMYTGGGGAIVRWGAPAYGDTPVPADYDGDGRADLAVYRRANGQWLIRLSASGGSFITTWGVPAAGDIPVPAKYDSDGRADVAVYRPTTGQWFIVQSTGSTTTVTWGSPAYGDAPVPADYDGDGRDDVAVARAFTGDWLIRRSSGGTSAIRWGFGDARVQGDYDNDGQAEVAIFRASTGTWVIRP